MPEQAIYRKPTEQSAQGYAEPAAAPTVDELALLDDDLTETDLETLHRERQKLFDAVQQLRSDDPNEVEAAFDVLADTKIIIKGTSYTLHERLGQGSFGDVFVVSPDDDPEQTFVMKLSQPFDRMTQYAEEFDSSNDKGTTHTARQLLREIAISKKLTRDEERPPCPKYIDGQLVPNPSNPDQRIALILMEKIEGTNLADIIGEAKDLRAYPDDMFDITLQLANAVQFIHSRNVLHSDIKPANTVLDDSGRIIVLDYGASSYGTVPDNAAAYKRELPGSTIGSDDYLPDEDITPSEQRDIYALGRSIQNMLFGDKFKYAMQEVLTELNRIKDRYEQSKLEAKIAAR